MSFTLNYDTRQWFPTLTHVLQCISLCMLNLHCSLCIITFDVMRWERLYLQALWCNQWKHSIGLFRYEQLYINISISIFIMILTFRNHTVKTSFNNSTLLISISKCYFENASVKKSLTLVLFLLHVNVLFSKQWC